MKHKYYSQNKKTGKIRKISKNKVLYIIEKYLQRLRKKGIYIFISAKDYLEKTDKKNKFNTGKILCWKE